MDDKIAQTIVISMCVVAVLSLVIAGMGIIKHIAPPNELITIPVAVVSALGGAFSGSRMKKDE